MSYRTRIERYLEKLNVGLEQFFVAYEAVCSTQDQVERLICGQRTPAGYYNRIVKDLACAIRAEQERLKLPTLRRFLKKRDQIEVVEAQLMCNQLIQAWSEELSKLDDDNTDAVHDSRAEAYRTLLAQRGITEENER